MSIHVDEIIGATPGEWSRSAACASQPGELWFPPLRSRGRARPDDYAQARLICNTCPVKGACLDHAIAVNEPAGMWGGLNPTERRRLRARTIRHGTNDAYCRLGCRCNDCRKAHRHANGRGR